MPEALSKEQGDLNTPARINDNLLPADINSLTDADSGKLFVPTVTKNGTGIDANVIIACNFIGTNGATTDNTDDPFAHAMSFADVSKISTVQFKTGTSSGFIDGIDANNPRVDFTLGAAGKATSKFSGSTLTVECWLRPDDIADDGVGLAWLDFAGFAIDVVADMSSGGFIIYTDKGGSENSWTVPHTWIVDTWVHYRMAMSGNTVTFAIDGTSAAVTPVATANPAIAAATMDNLTLGHASDTPATDNYQGYMDGLRISDNIRGTTSFTPQTSIFEVETYTTVLAPKAGFIYDTATDNITKPLQAHFFANLTSTQSNVTGNSEVYTIPYDGEIYDIGGNFNTGTGIFTAPITGKYGFSCLVETTGLVAGHSEYAIKLVTSNRTYVFQSINPLGVDIGTFLVQSGDAVLTDMDSGDTAKITIQVIGGTTVVDVSGAAAATPKTTFSGYLVL